MNSYKCAESVVQRTDDTPPNPAPQAALAQCAREYDRPYGGAEHRINTWFDAPRRGAVSGFCAERVRYGDVA